MVGGTPDRSLVAMPVDPVAWRSFQRQEPRIARAAERGTARAESTRDAVSGSLARKSLLKLEVEVLGSMHAIMRKGSARGLERGKSASSVRQDGSGVADRTNPGTGASRRNHHVNLRASGRVRFPRRIFEAQALRAKPWRVEHSERVVSEIPSRLLGAVLAVALSVPAARVAAQGCHRSPSILRLSHQPSPVTILGDIHCDREFGSVHVLGICGTVPPGLQFEASSGILSGIRPQRSFGFTVQAADPGGCVGTTGYTLVVSCPTIDLEPAMLSGTAEANSRNADSRHWRHRAIRIHGHVRCSARGLELSGAGAIEGSATEVGRFDFTVQARMSPDASEHVATPSKSHARR